jgi:hypothetical protein
MVAGEPDAATSDAEAEILEGGIGALQATSCQTRGASSGAWRGRIGCRCKVNRRYR